MSRWVALMSGPTCTEDAIEHVVEHKKQYRNANFYFHNLKGTVHAYIQYSTYSAYTVHVSMVAGYDSIFFLDGLRRTQPSYPRDLLARSRTRSHALKNAPPRSSTRLWNS